MMKKKLSVLFALMLTLIPQLALAAPATKNAADLQLIKGNLIYQNTRLPFAKTTTIKATTPAANRIYTIPDVAVDANFLMSSGTQTLVGPLTLTGANILNMANAGALIQNPAGTFTVQVTPGAELANRILNIPVLGATDTMMTLGTAQTVTGVKTFGTGAAVFPLAGSIYTGTSFNGTVKVLNAIGQASTFTIPDPGAATANFVLDTGASTIAGAKTMSGANILTMANAGCLIQNPAATFTVQLTPSAEVANRVLTIPLLGAADTLMTLGTAQAVTGIKTFSAGAALATMGTGTQTYSPTGRLTSLSALQTSSTGGAVNTTYTLPANTLTTTGQGLRVKIHGTTAANANAKACNFIFGATTITLPLSTGSGKDFWADILVYRTGASTQEISVAAYANAALANSLSTTSASTESSTISMQLNIPTSTGNGDVIVDEYTITAEQ